MAHHLQRLHERVVSPVLLPGDVLGGQLVRQDGDVDARPSGFPEVLDLRRRNRGSLELEDVRSLRRREVLEREGHFAGIAAILPRLPDTVLTGALVADEPRGLRSERPEMLDPTRPERRAEEPVGQGEALRVPPIVRDLALRVLDVAIEPRRLPAVQVVEAVHLAAVDRDDSGQERMVDVRRLVDPLLQRNRSPVTPVASRRAIGPREQTEQRVERSVLFDEEHDVLDLLLCEPHLRRVGPTARRGAHTVSCGSGNGGGHEEHAHEAHRADGEKTDLELAPDDPPAAFHGTQALIQRERETGVGWIGRRDQRRPLLMRSHPVLTVATVLLACSCVAGKAGTPILSPSGEPSRAHRRRPHRRRSRRYHVRTSW